MKHCELQYLCCCFSPVGNLMWIYSLFCTNLSLHPSVFFRLWRNQCVPLELWLFFSVWFTPFPFPHSRAVSVWPFPHLFHYIYSVTPPPSRHDSSPSFQKSSLLIWSRTSAPAPSDSSSNPPHRDELAAMWVGLRSPSKCSCFFWGRAFMWLDTLYHIWNHKCQPHAGEGQPLCTALKLLVCTRDRKKNPRTGVKRKEYGAFISTCSQLVSKRNTLTEDTHTHKSD